MCGNVCHTGNDTTDDPGDPVEAIRRSLVSADVDPVAASLNEVCFNQFEALTRVLPAEWHGRFAVAKTPSDDPDLCFQGGSAHRYGNALLTRRTIVDGSTEEFPLPHATSETRKLLCFRVDLVQDTRFCTTHIAPRGTWDVAPHAKQDDQIAEVTRHVNDYVDNGRPTILMGDFNVQPPSNKLDRVYHGPTFGGGAFGKFKEVGQGDPNATYPFTPPCRCGGLTWKFPNDLTEKIDFILASGRDWRIASGRVTNPVSDVNGRHSDHRILRGEVRLIH
jgi:endonuclease/exonuclease/phosphatase family metal-dependent hydrolase